MRFRCFNNMFGYCNGKPDQIIHHYTYKERNCGGVLTNVDASSTNCKKDLRSCGLFLSFNEILELNSAAVYGTEQKVT